MAGRDLIALNAWHYPDAKMANAIGPTLAPVLQAGKDISAMNLIVGKRILETLLIGQLLFQSEFL